MGDGERKRTYQFGLLAQGLELLVELALENLQFLVVQQPDVGRKGLHELHVHHPVDVEWGSG